MAEEDEEDLERLVVRAQILERQAEQLAAQLEDVERLVMEINRTIETLDNLSNTANNNLIPIGSGTYITVKGIEPDVYVSVGADLIVKKSSAEAKKILEKKLKELNRIAEDGRKKMDLINGLIIDVNKKATALNLRMQNVQPIKE